MTTTPICSRMDCDEPAVQIIDHRPNGGTLVEGRCAAHQVTANQALAGCIVTAQPEPLRPRSTETVADYLARCAVNRGLLWGDACSLDQAGWQAIADANGMSKSVVASTEPMRSDLADRVGILTGQLRRVYP